MNLRPPSPSLHAWTASLRRTETGRAVVWAYAFAVLVVAALVTIKQMATSPLGRDAPFLLMLGATCAVTWYGGCRAGILAAVLGTLAVRYFFLPPYDSWRSTPASTAQTALFGAEQLLVCGLTSMLLSARRQAERATRHVQGLYAVSSALVKSRTLVDVAQVIAREGAELLGATSSGVFVLDEGRGALRLVTAHTFEPTLAELLREVPMGARLPITEVVRTGELLCLARPGDLVARFPDLSALLPAMLAIRALACVPVVLDGRTIGALGFGFRVEHELSPEDRELARALARDCARAMERARLFEAEQRARLEADEASLAKDQFLGVVSHELRTPLTAISGWVHLLRRSGAADRARLEHGLDVIERNVRAQARLVEDVLDMSRIVARRLKVDRKPVDVGAEARAVVEELGPSAAARGVALSFECPGEALVAGDGDRLRQVTRNLVGNAIKFTASGGHVCVRVERAAGPVRLAVRDDGRGIDPRDLPHVFEMFRQVDASTTRREGGLGLGLAIVRHLVEAHGGTARIESDGLGRGTTAVVELPPLPVLCRALAAADPPAIPALAGVRVLVVEDDADARETVSSLLADAGAAVQQARSADEALEVLAASAPDVLVSDLAMPDRDGYWLIRRVRTMGTLAATVPAIALTAYASPEDATAARRAGFQRHLAKPAEPEALAGAVAELARGAA